MSTINRAGKSIKDQDLILLVGAEMARALAENGVCFLAPIGTEAVCLRHPDEFTGPKPEWPQPKERGEIFLQRHKKTLADQEIIAMLGMNALRHLSIFGLCAASIQPGWLDVTLHDPSDFTWGAPIFPEDMSSGEIIEGLRTRGYDDEQIIQYLVERKAHESAAGQCDSEAGPDSGDGGTHSYPGEF